MLDNRYALLFIRGERPVMDGKFDILRHPRVGGTADGKAEVFRHGAVTESVASVVFDEGIDPAKLPEITLPEGESYELLSEEDLELLFEKEDSSHEKEQQAHAAKR
jgi:type IV secretion system protein VirD4